MNPTCESCRWWHYPKMQCRRHAPHAVTLGTIQLPSWVLTAADDWCGEFEREPQKCERPGCEYLESGDTWKGKRYCHKHINEAILDSMGNPTVAD